MHWSLNTHQSLNALHTLYMADIVEQSIQALDILNIEAHRTFEYSIVRLNIHLTHINTEIVCYDVCQIDQQSHTVNTHNLDCGQWWLSLVLLPLNLLFHYAIAVLRCQTIQLVTGCLVNIYLMGDRVFESNHTISGQRVATLCHNKILPLVMLFGLVFLVITLCVFIITFIVVIDEKCPEFEYLEVVKAYEL
mgnify:CR=1 FL=1